MDFYEKSQNTLELPAVLEMLDAEAVTEGGKDQCSEHTPSGDNFEVKRKKKEN